MRIRSVLGASAVLLLTSASLAFAQTDCKTLVPPSPWGPNDQTGRAADLSPALMRDLGLETDDDVEVSYPWKED